MVHQNLVSPRHRQPPTSPITGDDMGDLDKLSRNQRWFLAIFVAKVALGLVAFAVKPWLGLLFFAATRSTSGGRSVAVTATTSKAKASNRCCCNEALPAGNLDRGRPNPLGYLP
jgi:hypothetical protein